MLLSIRVLAMATAAAIVAGIVLRHGGKRNDLAGPGSTTSRAHECRDNVMTDP